MNNQAQLFDATVKVDAIPVAGRRISISADADERAALAAIMQVDGVNGFSAELVAEKITGGVHVTGTLKARVTQACVVTFEPVEQSIEESVDRVFLPGPDIADDSSPGAEVFVDLEADDLPDHFSGNELDLNPLLLEIFGLAIDLYPRAPGAELPEDADDGDDESLNPFASLKALKQDDGPQN